VQSLEALHAKNKKKYLRRGQIPFKGRISFDVGAFSMNNQMQQLLKQAQAMQQKMMKAQEDLETITVTGSAGAGMVTITLNGKSDMRKINIESSLLVPTDKEVLEDLIIAAYNDARHKVEEESGKRMGEATAGMPLPSGFKMPF
jgi:nucleoid-associated protein EbfC